MDWPVSWPGGNPPAGTSEEHIALAESFAVTTLRMLTLYRVGGTPIKVIPCGRTCTSPVFKVDMFYPTQWTSAADLKACNCALGCSCAPVNWVWLRAPVGEVVEVSIDGVLVDPSDYYVENGEKLVRRSGAWPACTPGFTVTYLNAYPVNTMGEYVAGLLALEWLKAITGGKNCRLSSKVTSINRQGITMELAPGMFPDGNTGIPEVDLFIRQWNPNGLRQASKVYSVDLPVQRLAHGVV
jgi:hypothetical protein